MDDKRIVALLTRRAAGEISAEELSELRRLLSGHPDGVYYEEFVRELWRPFPSGPADSGDYYSRHLKRHSGELEFGRVPVGSFRGSGRVRLAVCALVLAVVSAVSVLWYFWGVAPADTGDRIEIVSERGVRKQLILPDGTKVWLNAGSRLVYDGLLDGSTREVRLEGEAYFDVTRNVNRPFIITTDKISIRVLGTTFNVKAYPDDARTEATLISGEIELSVNERPKEKILMKPNEKVAVVDHPQAGVPGESAEKRLTLTIGNLSKVQVADKEYIRETSWISNKLIFKDETLGEIVPKLERWYDVDISLRDPGIRGYRYTATITEEDIGDVLSAMRLIKSFHFKIDSNDVIIY